MANPNDKLSRRALLRGAAAAVPAGVLAACGGDNTPTGPNADITPLNALLVAEYTAIATYMAGINILNAPPAGDPLIAQSGALAAIATQWMAQHTAHSVALKNAVMAIGGTPALQAGITFTPPAGVTLSITNVLKIAANAEKGAAIAYNNTVATLSSAGNRFLAATIEGDETQHFVVLYSLLKGLAAPTTALASMGTSGIVPKTFVSTPTGGDMTTSLEGLANFTYS